MNIGRNVLMIVCVLSVSMILSSCDKGGNHTANEWEDLSMSDVNDILVNEEEKPVEPKNIYWINEDLTNQKHFEYSFTASKGNGTSLNIAVQNYSSARIQFIVYVDGKREENIIKGNGGKTLSYTINKTKTFRVTLDPYGGDSYVFSASIRARQF